METSHSDSPTGSHSTTEKKFQLNQSHFFLFILMFLTLTTCFLMLKPYINAIIMAVILAMILAPFHQHIENRLGNRKNLAAFITTILLYGVIVIPLMAILFAFTQQGIHSFNSIADWFKNGHMDQFSQIPLIQTLLTSAQSYLNHIQERIPGIQLNQVNLNDIPIQLTSSIGKFFMNQGGYFVGNMTALVLNFFLMLITFFFIIRDQKEIFDNVLHIVPLSNQQERKIIAKIKDVSQSAILGTFVTAIAQGFAGGIAFFICGFPGLFWGTAMAFSSFIPMIGTALIWVPAAGYLFLTGHWGYGIFMVVWSVVVVGLIDNLIRPFFMKGGANMSPCLIFFSIIGGIHYFGFIGLIYGPLIFGLTMVFFYIYSLEFEEFLNAQDQQ